METIKRETLETILRLFNSASNDDTRECLQGVYIDLENKCFVAANGHILSQVIMTDDELASMTNTFTSNTILSNDYSVIIKKVLKNKIKSFFSIRVDLKNVLIDDEKCFTIIDREYPKYQNVLPRYEEDICISLNPELLLDVFKSLNTIGKKCQAITIKVNQESVSSYAPIKLQVGNNSGVIIPIKKLIIK